MTSIRTVDSEPDWTNFWNPKKLAFRHWRISDQRKYQRVQWNRSPLEICKLQTPIRVLNWESILIHYMDSTIRIRKATCIRALNIIKYLSHPSKGLNWQLLLNLYKSLIHSCLDYRSPTYNFASKSVLKLLGPIQTQSLRLTLGAFCTSPLLSLCRSCWICSLL